MALEPAVPAAGEPSRRRSSRGVPPTAAPGASLAGLPPAVSSSPRVLARKAGVPVSGIDWGNLNDGKQFSKFLLVFRLQNGRGKAERRDSRREARNAPARSWGRGAGGFARELTVVCPAPSGPVVALTVGVRGAPGPGDMPVRFKVRPGSPGREG